MNKKYFFRCISVLVLAAGYHPLALSDYILATPPRETKEESIAIYQPVADYFSKVTGEKFVFRGAENWSDYTSAMKNQEFDVVFDGAHFVSWRIKYINHEILAKLPELLIWRIVAAKDNVALKSLDDLIGKKLCAPKTPNFWLLDYNEPLYRSTARADTSCNQELERWL